MALVIVILKAIMWFVVGVMMVYATRHMAFTISRVRGRQRLYYQDIVDDDLPRVSVLIPMHNEQEVARDILKTLVKSHYPPHLLEIIPVNDYSEDGTANILDEFAAQFPQIKPLHRYEGIRGKPAALNEAMKLAFGDIVIVFDADYLPSTGLVREH